MRSRKLSGGIHIIRLDKGEEITSSLASFCADNKIGFATVSGIGAADEIVVSVFDVQEKRYIEQSFQGDLEIVSLCGNVALANDKPKAHVHCAFAGDHLEVHGGHLVSAIISVTCELVLNASDGRVERKKDEESGLMLLEI